MDPIASFRSTSKSTIQHLKDELKTIRTGKPSPSLIESLQVNAYGSKMRLMELASISVESNNSLAVQPFDVGTIQNIEKAIHQSPIGISPKLQDNRILVLFPDLTQEQREKFTKLVGQYIEDHRVQIRSARDEAKKKIRTQFDAKDITEDDKYRLEKDLDKATNEVNDEIQSIKEVKEKQIREI